jgi:hypothetical protein
MGAWLPPLDPHEEPFGEPPDGVGLAAPTTVFARGLGSREIARVAEAIIDARPGLLIVVAGA